MEAYSSSPLLKKDFLQILPQIRSNYNNFLDARAQRKAANSCDAKVSSLVLLFFAAISLGVGAYFAVTSGPAFFSHGGTENLALLCTGGGFGLLGTGFVIWTVAIACRTKGRNKEINREIKESNSEILEFEDLLEFMESEEVNEDALNTSINYIFSKLEGEHRAAFFNYLQERYFSDDLEIDISGKGKVLSVLYHHIDTRGMVLESHYNFNEAFALNILAHISNAPNSEHFIKNLFESVGKTQNALQVYKHYPEIATEVFFNDQNYLLSIYRLMEGLLKSRFTAALSQFANSFPLFDKTFAKAILSEIDFSNVAYTALLDKLFAGLGAPQDDDDRKIYAKDGLRAAKYAFENPSLLSQEEAGKVFLWMQPEQKSKFFDYLNQNAGSIDHFEKAFAKVALPVAITYHAQANLIDKLFAGLGVPQEEDDRKIYARYGENVARYTFGNLLSLSQADALQIFAFMQPEQKSAFIAYIDQNKANIPAFDKALAGVLLRAVEPQKDQLSLLIDKLFSSFGMQNSDEDSKFYAAFPEKTVEYMLRKESPLAQGEALRIFAEMDDILKVRFLNHLQQIGSGEIQIEPKFSRFMLLHIAGKGLKDRYNILISRLMANPDVRENIYAEYPEQLAADIMANLLTEQTILGALKTFGDLAKIEFLNRLHEISTRLSEKKDKEKAGGFAYQCIVSILTPDFAKQESFPEDLMNAIAKWPHEAAWHMIVNQYYLKAECGRALEALYGKMDEEQRKIFDSSCANAKRFSSDPKVICEFVLASFSNGLPLPLKNLVFTLLTQRKDLLKPVILDSKLEPKVRYGLALELLESWGKDAEKEIGNLDRLTVGNPNFEAMLEILAEEAKNDTISVERLGLMKFFSLSGKFAKAKKAKEKNIDFTQFEEKCK